jgi:hypothetical protein
MSLGQSFHPQRVLRSRLVQADDSLGQGFRYLGRRAPQDQQEACDSDPPPGWWAKKAAGKSVKQTPLPKAKAGSGDKVTIAGGELSQEQPSIAAVREQARILASGEKPDAAPHPIVERTLAKLRKAKPSAIGIASVAGPGLIKCDVAPETIDRLGVILSQIVQAATMQGFRLIDGDPSARFSDEAESVGFAISELTRREKHILTEAEQAKEDGWLLKRERAKADDRGSSALVDDRAACNIQILNVPRD